jgi:hypothetical protein
MVGTNPMVDFVQYMSDNCVLIAEGFSQTIMNWEMMEIDSKSDKIRNKNLLMQVIFCNFADGLREFSTPFPVCS